MRFIDKIKKVAIMATFGLMTLPQTVMAQCDPNGTITSGIDCAKGDTPVSTIEGPGGLLAQIVNILLFAVGIISVIMIIIGGIRYATSAGNEKATQGAKDTILYAIIGLVISVLAFAIINYVIAQLSKSV
jgi:ABC-type Fe3+ transport system permease subunit